MTFLGKVWSFESHLQNKIPIVDILSEYIPVSGCGEKDDMVGEKHLEEPRNDVEPPIPCDMLRSLVSNALPPIKMCDDSSLYTTRTYSSTQPEQ